MENIEINGIKLTPEAIVEIRSLQTGSNAEGFTFDNSGINLKMDALQNMSDFLVRISGTVDDCYHKEILGILQDVQYLKDSFLSFKAPGKGGKS
ncbi:MAG: hypothetical protein N4A59_16365 [Marinifilum sp.]|jgi:hypothetical protein|nr:hypothetical protein [Marinifilum sp.]